MAAKNQQLVELKDRLQALFKATNVEGIDLSLHCFETALDLSWFDGANYFRWGLGSVHFNQATGQYVVYGREMGNDGLSPAIELETKDSSAALAAIYAIGLELVTSLRDMSEEEREEVVAGEFGEFNDPDEF